MNSPLIKFQKSNSYIKSSWFKIKHFLKFIFTKYKNFKILPILGDNLDIEYISYIKNYLNNQGINYYLNNTDFLKSFNSSGPLNIDIRSNYLLKILTIHFSNSSLSLACNSGVFSLVVF